MDINTLVTRNLFQAGAVQHLNSGNSWPESQDILKRFWKEEALSQYTVNYALIIICCEKNIHLWLVNKNCHNFTEI